MGACATCGVICRALGKCCCWNVCTASLSCDAVAMRITVDGTSDSRASRASRPVVASSDASMSSTPRNTTAESSSSDRSALLRSARISPGVPTTTDSGALPSTRRARVTDVTGTTRQPSPNTRRASSAASSTAAGVGATTTHRGVCAAPWVRLRSSAGRMAACTVRESIAPKTITWGTRAPPNPS